jgi:hypothetical protein
LNCPYCHQPLIEIDHYGERWLGCIQCNKWGQPGDTKLVLELAEEDWEALKALRESN